MEGKDEEALKFAEKASGTDPENVDAALLLVQLYMDTGRGDDAEKLMNSLQQKMPGNVAVLEYRLLLMQNSRNYDGVESAANEIIANPQAGKFIRIKALHALGDAYYFRSGDYDKAENFYKKALELSPGDPQTLLKIAMIKSGRQQFKELYAVVAEAEKHRDRLDREGLVNLYYWKGHANVFLGNIKEAEKAYKKALELDPEKNYEPPNIAYTYLSQLDENIAKEILRDSHFKNSDYLFEANKAGQLWSSHSMSNRGLKDMEESYRKGKFDPSLWWALGNLYREINRYNDAERVYRDLIKKDPGSIEGHLGLGACLLVNGKEKEAEEIFDEWGAKLPPNRKNELYHITSSVYLWKLKDYEKAEENLKLYLKYASPDNPKPLMEMGYLRLKQGRTADAGVFFKKLLTVSKPVYFAHLEVATTYARVGITDKALEHIQAAQEDIEKLLPGVRALMYYRSAFILYHLSKFDESFHYAELSDKLAPGKPETVVLLSRIYREKGDKKSSKDFLDRALKIDPDNEQTLMEIKHPDRPDPARL